jgi:hypothetical protein
MTKEFLAKYKSSHDIVVTFANTGEEDERTLEFVNNCDKVFGFGTVWIEAVQSHGKRVGPRAKVVTFETAARHGEPFEDYVRKYGIPNAANPQCTSRMKTEAMDHYVRHVHGWKRNTYVSAIGIRADELDRVDPKHKEHRLIYPLLDAGWTKQMVKDECRKWPFDLELKGEHQGNCRTCWKKSNRKLYTLIDEDVSRFRFFRELEEKYSHVKCKNDEGRRVFFRGKRSTVDLFADYSVANFIPYSDTIIGRDPDLDTDASCGASCEAHGV